MASPTINLFQAQFRMLVLTYKALGDHIIQVSFDVPTYKLVMRATVLRRGPLSIETDLVRAWEKTFSMLTPSFPCQRRFTVTPLYFPSTVNLNCFCFDICYLEYHTLVKKSKEISINSVFNLCFIL